VEIVFEESRLKKSEIAYRPQFSHSYTEYEPVARLYSSQESPQKMQRSLDFDIKTLLQFINSYQSIFVR